MQRQFALTMEVQDNDALDRKFRLETRGNDAFLIMEFEGAEIASRLVPPTPEDNSDFRSYFSAYPAQNDDFALGGEHYGKVIAELIMQRPDLTYTQIAKETNISRATVANVAKRFNLHRPVGRKVQLNRMNIANLLNEPQ